MSGQEAKVGLALAGGGPLGLIPWLAELRSPPPGVADLPALARPGATAWPGGRRPGSGYDARRAPIGG